MIDLDRLRRFFEVMDARGEAPKWDNDESGTSRWGYRDKIEEIRTMAKQKWPSREEK